jgi:hypothetical protein
VLCLTTDLSPDLSSAVVSFVADQKSSEDQQNDPFFILNQEFRIIYKDVKQQFLSTMVQKCVIIAEGTCLSFFKDGKQTKSSSFVREEKGKGKGREERREKRKNDILMLVIIIDHSIVHRSQNARTW